MTTRYVATFDFEGEPPQVSAGDGWLGGVLVDCLLGRDPFELRPKEEWHEGIGDVLWWAEGLGEPPYVGGPLDTDWPGYHTQWSYLPIPRQIRGAA